MVCVFLSYSVSADDKFLLILYYVTGNPMDEDTKVGAMISEEHAQRVMGYIDIARKEVREN